MKHKLSIIIPCYNQTELLKRNLKYLEKQTFKDFGIVILDDNSTEDYKKIISEFPNFDISYIRNSVTAGAIGNIFNSILYKTDSLYTLSLHEDDVICKDYLQKSVEILDKENNVAFVATIANWFKTDIELEKKFNETKNISDIRILSKSDFVLSIIDWKHITFGSIVYRNSILNEKPDLKKYGVFCDRPFLISLIKNDSKVGLIQDKAIFVRDHGENDTRFQTITEENGFNLMLDYKNNLPSPISASDEKKMEGFATNGLLSLYAGLKNKKLSFYQLIKKGRSLGLINFLYINTIGITSIFILIFSKKIFNILIKIIKK